MAGAFFENALTLGIIIALIIIIYTRIMKQSLKDTIEELKDIFSIPKEVAEERIDSLPI